MSIIDWIQVGKVSAERDDLLSKYFFDNGLLKSIINSPSSFLVLGRKGAGKTAVFKYLTENYEEFISTDDILISLSFEDYNWNIHSLLSNKDKAESLSYKQSWKLIILIESIKALYDRYQKSGATIPNEIRKANKLLEKIFDTPIPSIYQIVSKKLLSLSGLKLPKAGIDVAAGNFESFELGGGEVSFDEVKRNQTLQEALSENIENLIKVLDELLSSIDDIKYRVFICFDRIDEAWDDVSFESSKRVIAGLISASDSITSAYNDKIRPIIFLREDIFEVLSINDSNKLREDCGELLHWNKPAIEKLLLARINYFANINNIVSYPEIKLIFEDKEMRQRAKPFNYILKRSMMRPRDLICFISKIISSMKEAAEDPFSEEKKVYSELNSDSIYAAEPAYSEWLKQEIIDEWSVQNPVIKKLFDAIQNNNSTNFTQNELKTELTKILPDITTTQVVNHLRFLFENSIIGFKVGASTEWRFKCFYPSQGFLSSEEYRVHEGLVRALNLKENRER